MKKLLLLFVFGFILINCKAQQFIADTCFEYFRIPKNGRSVYAFDLKYWGAANKTTPDLFISNNPGPLYRFPKNYVGKRYPYCKNSYVGIVTFSKDIKHLGQNYREYLSTKLKQKLTSGNLYCLSLAVSLADTCNYASDGLEAFFSKNKVKDNYIMNLSEQPQIRNIGGNIVTYKNGWAKISSIYKANGDENFLTIGNFKDDEHTSLMQVNKIIKKSDFIAESAYYYIGYVSLKPILSEAECSCISNPISNDSITKRPITSDTGITERQIVLNDIYFDYDKSVLLQLSYAELDTIAAFLKGLTSRIEISGHTDNIGIEEHNIELSEARAKSVAEYLISKGIERNRIICKGYGSSKPVANNSTEEGRRKNRRVEILIK